MADPTAPGRGVPTLRGIQLARNALLNIAAQLLPLLVVVLTIPSVIRGLGEARFGLLSLSWVILGYFGVFDLGMGRAATKFVAEALGRGDEDAIPGLVWTAASIQAAFGVAGGLALAALTPLLAGRVFTIPPELVDDATASFYLLAIAIPMVLIASSFRGVLEAAQRFDLVNLVRVPSTCANYLLALAGVALGFGLPAIIALLVAGRCISTLAFLFLALRLFPALRRASTVERVALRRLAGFGGWITVSAVTIPMLSYIEHFFIATLLSIGALTFYAVPFEMVSRTTIFPAALALTLFPAYSFLQAGQSEQIGELSWRPLKLLLAAVLPLLVVLVAFAPQILDLWLGAEFAARSATVLRILAVAFAINALAAIPFSAVQGLGRPDLKARLDLVEVPLFAFLAWLLIPDYGIVGAALAKLSVIVLDTVALFWFAARLGALSPLRIAARGMPAALLAGGAYLVAALALPHAVAPSLGGRIAIAALATAAFLVVFWKLAMDDRDRELLGQIRLLRSRDASTVVP